MTLRIGDIAPDFTAGTTSNTQTSVPGIYAADDIAGSKRQIATAAAGGTAATHSISGCRSGETCVEIRLIGELTVLKNGSVQAPPNSRKTRALLAYLILNPGPQRRERLCEIFWQVPDDPRGSLRWSLSKLRNLVDGAGVARIVANRETVAFDSAGAGIDIFRLREALANGVTALDAGKLAELASITSRGLLPGLDLSGQPDFARFLASQRETFRTIRRDLLCALIRRRLGHSPADAASWLQDLVEIEPYSVQAHAALIATLIRAGRKQDAEGQLKSSVSILSEIDGIDLAALRRAAAGKPQESGSVQLFMAPVTGSGLAHSVA